ncbi:C5a anaphylatoxin chemotactic receptor 1 [Kryptolebias marmoratus]|uniref:Complement C5a receptor 1 n=1 Tax=Kryptolebias marmoratus TaxID=37003 RepID=A0A3Q2ZH82_KRYMA|nr:C5a anaphylatoxin chemotactic receptor 1 [Kryptolebias marmoratus]XP_037837930.1 C5a anaphylatoxin chemotactic receptor 1 [Kryptolebias marmoratus]
MDQDYNLSDLLEFENWTLPPFPDMIQPEIQPIQIVALVFYGLVVLLGVPGNAVVLWVTGFCMTRSVTSIWFLNLALADFLCCLSLPLLMVPLAHDDHWHFGSLACTLIKGLFYLVMYCSVLQLVLISLDRLMLVKKPIWCQNNRRPTYAAFGCVAVWCLALVGSIPQFVYALHIEAGEYKTECVMAYPRNSVWFIASFQVIMGFILPFLVIVICHLMVYSSTQRGMSRGRTRSKRTLKVIVAVVLTFFLCWVPLHIINFIDLNTPAASPHSPKLYIAHVLALCLAYFNSCLNPLIYVCMGRSFKDSVNRSLRNFLHFITEEPHSRGSEAVNNTKSTTTSTSKDMTKI